MDNYQTTTPFGRRRLTLAHIASQVAAKARSPDKAVHKWAVFRDICAAKERLGATERALAVLNALLTFHPETVLSGEGLVVFPSNLQLAQRAHGMAPATLRRHLSVLIGAGLIIRRDSPNGKRYARKGRGGEIDLAFGFDLSPLVAGADEFAALADQVRADEQTLKRLKERITLCRRDIVKMIETGVEESQPGSRQESSEWAAFHERYREIVDRIPRTASIDILEPLAAALAMLGSEILKALERRVKTENTSANESQTERHKQISNTKPTDSDPSLRKGRGGEGETVLDRSGALERHGSPERQSQQAYPLGMVMAACPDLADYAKDGIANWRDFLATTKLVRSMLGISPSAFEEARDVMGEIPSAIMIACLLQKGAAIKNAGGYVRELTRKAEAQEFSIGPMIMALIGSRKREARRA